jgi:hypothetical protein
MPGLPGDPAWESRDWLQPVNARTMMIVPPRNDSADFVAERYGTAAMLWRTPSQLVALCGLIEPCLSTRADRPRCGPDWVYEIKHDGYRRMVRRVEDGVRTMFSSARMLRRRFFGVAAGSLEGRLPYLATRLAR